MSDLMKQGDQFIRSAEPATPTKSKNGYGQNAFGGPSSDLPGQKTTSGFLPQGNVPSGDWQTRKLDAKAPLSVAHGMLDPNRNNPKVPANGRPVTTRK